MTYTTPFIDRSQLPSFVTIKSALANTAFFRAVSIKAALESSTARYVAQRTLDGVEKRPAHPITKTLARRMNLYATPNITLHTAIVHRETTGNGYLKVQRFDTGIGGIVTRLHNTNPYDFIPFLMEGEKFFYCQSDKRVYLNSEIIHLMRFSVDGVTGLNPLEVFCPTFNLHNALNSYVVRYFRRNTVISGVIQCPAGVTLTPEQHTQAAEDLAGLSLSSSTDRRYDVPFLPFGLQWVNVSPPSNEHTKLIETLAATERQICQVMDLPPAVLFAAGTGGDLEAVNRDVVRTVLRTDFENMEQEFSKLLTEDEQDTEHFIAFDEDSLLRGDSRRVDQLVKEVNAGTLTVNEYRRERDLPDLTGGNTPRMPVSVSQPISEGGADNKPDTTKQETGGTGGAQGATFSKRDLSPLIADVVRRVQAKESKAFESHLKKNDQESWFTFASTQGEYLRDALTPLIDAFDLRFDVDALCISYRDRVANRTGPACDLKSMIEGALQ